MRSLDDDGDFCWKCSFCFEEMNVRYVTTSVKVETWDTLTGQDQSRFQKDYTFCDKGCQQAYWYGP